MLVYKPKIYRSLCIKLRSSLQKILGVGKALRLLLLFLWRKEQSNKLCLLGISFPHALVGGKVYSLTVYSGASSGKSGCALVIMITVSFGGDSEESHFLDMSSSDDFSLKYGEKSRRDFKYLGDGEICSFIQVSSDCFTQMPSSHSITCKSCFNNAG